MLLCRSKFSWVGTSMTLSHERVSGGIYRMNEGIIKSSGTFSKVSINSKYVNTNSHVGVGTNNSGTLEVSNRVKVTKDEVRDMLKEKQDKLVAGNGILLNEDTNVISVSTDKIVVKEGENISDLTALYLLAKGEN